MKQTEIIQRFIDERSRQFNLPGREFDINNTLNDWAAKIISYVAETIIIKQKLEINDYEDSLIKAAAVIIAALEHVDVMKKEGYFL